MDDDKKLGATGEFPDGQNDPSDEGALRFALGIRRGEVCFQFGTPVTWFSMPREVALSVAASITRLAHQLPSSPGHVILTDTPSGNGSKVN